MNDKEIRPSMLTKGVFSSTTDLWETPHDFFNKLNDEFHFNLDPCATSENAKCPKYYTKEDDGLSKNWGGGIEYFAIRHTAGQLGNG